MVHVLKWTYSVSHPIRCAKIKLLTFFHKRSFSCGNILYWTHNKLEPYLSHLANPDELDSSKSAGSGNIHCDSPVPLTFSVNFHLITLYWFGPFIKTHIAWQSPWSRWIVCDMQNYINYGLNYIDIKLINMYTVTHKRK